MQRQERTWGAVSLLSDAPGVWEARDPDWPGTWRVLSPEYKQSPLCEYKVLEVGAQIENRTGSLECGGYRNCFEYLVDISLAAAPITRIFKKRGKNTSEYMT